MRQPRVRLWPYKRGSASARALAREMGVLRLRFLHRNFIPRQHDLIINWGAKENPYPDHEGWLNHPDNVAVAQNKLLTYQVLRDSGVPVPAFTTDRSIAAAWMGDGRSMVVARTLLRASAGRGIVLARPGEELPNAPLYTRYEKKRNEYRVHIMKVGDSYEIIDSQEKRRRAGGESNSQIRNSTNGWVYCREEVSLPEGAANAARTTVHALNLDFGAVDLGWNAHYGRACVYECNTAPGLEGSTLTNYAESLSRSRDAQLLRAS